MNELLIHTQINLKCTKLSERSQAHKAAYYLSAYILQKEKLQKETAKHKRMFWNDGTVLYPDCGGSYIPLCSCLTTDTKDCILLLSIFF